MPEPVIEARAVSKFFGTVVALADVSMRVHAGEVVCLLGDNGAGKSTLIKLFSGFERPDRGTIAIDGVPVSFASPRDAFASGIATVYQDLAVLPEMSISRNFMLGMEPRKWFGPFAFFDEAKAGEIARAELAKIGIQVNHLRQKVGTMSGGERQSLAIARAVYFGAKVLILDEPTSALGVRQTSIVLRYVAGLRKQGIGIIFITHNVRHAYAIGDRFTVLNRGRTPGTFTRVERSRDQLEELMAGGREMADLTEHLSQEALESL
jgi:simple sugar transport system ATP-binding protein